MTISIDPSVLSDAMLSFNVIAMSGSEVVKCHVSLQYYSYVNANILICYDK